MQGEMASCPFNSSHTFSKDKFVFHLNRCKDRQKVEHLFRRCPYNSLHFIKRQLYEEHELTCPNKMESLAMVELARRNYYEAREDRERSLDKVKKIEEIKKQENNFDQDQDIVLSDCEDCQKLMVKYSHRLEEDERFQRYIKKYKDLKEKEIEIMNL